MINKAPHKHHHLLQFAKTKGFLSPLWLLPNTDPDGVQRAFQELESFLHNAYQQNELTAMELSDVDEFIWKLKKTYAFKGWEGIAPYLLTFPTHSTQSANEGLYKPKFG
ncbi:MAG TPA: hypothetical protein VJC18_02310 [bacterium]|nr:hypothetical protein [bacterium]